MALRDFPAGHPLNLPAPSEGSSCAPPRRNVLHFESFVMKRCSVTGFDVGPLSKCPVIIVPRRAPPALGEVHAPLHFSSASAHSGRACSTRWASQSPVCVLTVSPRLTFSSASAPLHKAVGTSAASRRSFRLLGALIEFFKLRLMQHRSCITASTLCSFPISPVKKLRAQQEVKLLFVSSPRSWTCHSGSELLSDKNRHRICVLAGKL